MPTPQEFLKRISDIVGDDITDGEVSLKISWTNREEGKEALRQIRRMQAELRQLNRDISSSASDLRSEYATKKVSVGTGFGAGVAMGFFGRRRMGKVNAMKRDSLREQQIAATKPYEAVKRVLAEVNRLLSEAKTRVENSEEYQTPSAPRRATRGSAHDQHTYFVKIGGETRGPMTAEQVRGLVIAGIANEETEVQMDGVEAWLQLRTMKALRADTEA